MTELTGLFPLLRGIPAWGELLERLQHRSPLPDLQVIGAARPFVLAALAREWDGPVLSSLPAWTAPGTSPASCRSGCLTGPCTVSPNRCRTSTSGAPWGDAAIRSRIAALAALHAPDGAQGARSS